MNPHELSDADADALTITTQGDRTWITCTSGGHEVTVGPFATDAIAAGFPTDPMDGGVTAALIEQEAEKPDPAVDYHAMWWKAEREREKAERERDGAIAFMTEAQEEATRQAVRADTSEKERDEARANAYNWEATAEEWEKIAIRAEKARLDRDRWWRKWRETEDRAARAEWLLDEAYAGARPLTPDGVRRALDVAVESFATSCPPCDEPYNAWKVRQATWEALRELFPNVPQSAPARPDWQDLADTLRDIDPAETLSIDELAEAAHKRGVRAPEDGAA